MSKKYKKFILQFKQLFTKSATERYAYKATGGWLVLVVTSGVCCVVLCFVGVYVFFVHPESSNVQNAEITVQQILGKKHIDEVMGLYREQTKKFNSLRNSVPYAPDTGNVLKIVEPLTVDEEGVEGNENEFVDEDVSEVLSVEN